MNFPSTQFLPSRRPSIYESVDQIGMWGENFNGSYSTSPIMIMESENTSQGAGGPTNKCDEDATIPLNKIQRRLAQNRQAARKSRLRKKAYIRQLETSRLKLLQMEHELERARRQGLHISAGLDTGHLQFSGAIDSGIAAFAMEYEHWIEVQNRQTNDLRAALHAHTSDIELRVLVDRVMSHYYKLFHMKAIAASADVFYLMFGMWRTTAEHFFSWIGGFRPSEILKVLVSQLDPLTDQQLLDICNLKQSCQQAEDALSQGMEKHQQNLAENVAAGQLGGSSYIPQVAVAMEKLENLILFVTQADYLRQGTLQQMVQILTTRQAAGGLLAVGEYFQRLRALSSLWSTCLPKVQ